MKNVALALRYNGWLLFGWIRFLPGLLGLGGSFWELVSSFDNYSTANLAVCALEKWFLLSAFSAIPIIVTRNGSGTLRVYRKPSDASNTTLGRVRTTRNLCRSRGT
jgi:hypothetical protein